MEEDLLFLEREKGLSRLEAKKILSTHDIDVVEAILSLEGVVINNIKTENLTQTQKDIKKLREIVDKKDEIMNDLINKKNNK